MVVFITLLRIQPALRQNDLLRTVSLHLKKKTYKKIRSLSPWNRTFKTDRIIRNGKERNRRKEICIVRVSCVLVCTFTQEEARIRRKGSEQRETPIELPGQAKARTYGKLRYSTHAVPLRGFDKVHGDVEN